MHQQVRFEANVFFLSDDVTHLNQLYLFGHVARASPEDDCRRAFMAEIRKPRPDVNNKKNALEQPGPGAWRTILQNWISAFTQILDSQKIDHAGVEPRSRSCMKFANKDDDDIYDSEHRLKWPGLKKLKYIFIQ